MAQEATGSIWNANNWHWEEKSHSKRAQSFLKEALERPTGLRGNGFEIVLKNVVVSGDATTSVRKQKLLLALDLNVKADWGVCTEGKETSVCGRLEARELSEDASEDGDFYFSCSSTSGGEAVPSQQEALSILKKRGKDLIQKALQMLVSTIRSQESDKDRLDFDKEQRQCAAAASQKAREQMGEQQQNIARQQKEADAARKLAAAAESSHKTQEPALAGTGSVWNANSYHWEEKPMTAWCLSTLTERFEQLKVALSSDIEVCFFNVKTTGEASTSIRKAKKIVIFDLEVRADWKATARNGDGTFLGGAACTLAHFTQRRAKAPTFRQAWLALVMSSDTKGSMTVKEFNSENPDEFVLTVTDDEGLPPQKKIGEIVKQEAPAQLRDFLAKFVDDLRARG